jgi:maltose alpha-D-glucosyltransferase/alpha-amylase
MIDDLWYKNAILYCLDVKTFMDSNGDGVGDFEGLTRRLPYLAGMGVSAIWLLPFSPSPMKDNGYDITDYYGIEPALGSLGDFAELAREADERGMRIILDLVVNHTSDEHPWFVSARSSPDSPYRDWYVWSADEPPNRRQGTVFPGEQEETWTFDKQAQAWYFHRFYGFQPDLNWANPAVQREMAKVMNFWLQMGAAGFRIDAAPFIIEMVEPGVDSGPQDFSILESWRQETQWVRGDSVLLCEANLPPSEIGKFVGSRPDGPTDRTQMMFDFLLNPRMWLALARSDAEPLIEALKVAVKLPQGGQWVSFLRNHDELDLSRLTDEQRSDAFNAFAPREEMRLYGRGIRRRLAPMLEGDRRRIELAYALQLSLPGTPALRYGEEIGMGEDLSLDGREAIRTPMQWDDTPNAGFSPAAPKDLFRPVVMSGRFGAENVNVRRQQQDPDSLLRWFENLMHTLRTAPEIGTGSCSVIDASLPRSVLAHRFDAQAGSILLLHNLADTTVTVDLGPLPGTDGDPYDLLVDGEYDAPTKKFSDLKLNGWGYRWIRLSRSDQG